jgi:hypothetical protein
MNLNDGSTRKRGIGVITRELSGKYYGLDSVAQTHQMWARTVKTVEYLNTN